jgi:ornithine cyclodeaminase
MSVSTASEPLWLTEADVAGLVALPDAIEIVERWLLLEASGGARTMEKTHVAWGDGHGLHAIGAAATALVGTKTWAHTAGGATPLMVLWDSRSGRLRAVIEAFVLGQLRTGAVSGVATRWLAHVDADELALIGTGKQAMTQVAAVAAVRPLSRVRVFSPNAEHRAAFVARLGDAGFGFHISEARSVAEAVDGCAIVTTATRARVPFLDSAMVARGAHVNAVGAITPERREVSADLVARASTVVSDDPSTARRLASELATTVEIVSLSSVVSGGRGRPRDSDVTLFKAMGIGLADLAVAAEVLERAEAGGIGRRFAHPEKVAPRLHGGS